MLHAAASAPHLQPAKLFSPLTLHALFVPIYNLLTVRCKIDVCNSSAYLPDMYFLELMCIHIPFHHMYMCSINAICSSLTPSDSNDRLGAQLQRSCLMSLSLDLSGRDNRQWPMVTQFLIPGR